MASINEIFHKYLRNNSELQTIFGVDRYNKANVYYTVNDKVKQPFGTIWMIEDPRAKTFLCNDKSGQALFQCDTFTKNYVNGINYRETFIDEVKKLQPYTTQGITIWQADITDVNDRADTVQGLFQFSFTVMLNWYK
jgi:hypothetical protein